MELRPLGFGEIFDRAITLYIRNFLPFAGIVAVVVLPIAVLQYFIDTSSMTQFDQAMKKILSVSKQELQKRLEAEKKAKEGK